MGCHGGEVLSSYLVLVASMSGDFRENNASANTPMILSGDTLGSHFYQKMAGILSAVSSMSGYTNFQILLS